MKLNESEGVINIDVQHYTHHFNFDIKNKVTVLSGDSGTGKTLLLNILRKPTLLTKTKVDGEHLLEQMCYLNISSEIKMCLHSIKEENPELDIKTLAKSHNKDDIRLYYKLMTKYWESKNDPMKISRIVLVDGELSDIVKTVEFAARVNADTINYYVLMVRGQLLYLKYSKDDVYKFVTHDGGFFHTVEPYYKEEEY